MQVKEDETGRQQNNTATMVMFRYNYRLQLIKTANAFKPGMPYVAYLKVANLDGSPVVDDLNRVAVRWGFHLDTAKYNTTTFKVPPDGILELVVRSQVLIKRSS